MKTVELWMNRWLMGECAIFALALSEQLPAAEFVGVRGMVAYHHVGLRLGGAYYDVRGELTEGEFKSGLFGGAEVIEPISRNTVLQEAEFGSFIGHEDELSVTSEMRAARAAVKRAFPHLRKTSTVTSLSQAKTSAGYTRPLAFYIEVPYESRTQFFAQTPAHNYEFWAFKDRPYVLVGEKLIFTFDRRPVAEAVVHHVEDPGRSKCDATGKFERYHKVFWNPTTFKRYKTASDAKVAAEYDTTLDRNSFYALVVQNFKKEQAQENRWRVKVTIYHGTDSLTAEEINQSGHFQSGKDWPSFFTLSKKEAQDYARIRAKQKQERSRRHADGTEATPVVYSLRIDPWCVTRNSGSGELETLPLIPLYFSKRHDLGTSVLAKTAAGCDWRNTKTKTLVPETLTDYPDFLVLLEQFAESSHFTGGTSALEVAVSSAIPVQYMPTEQAMADIQPWSLDEDDRGEPHIAELMAAMQQGVELPPAVVGREGKVIDGRHRIHAAHRLGIPEIPYIRLTSILKKASKAINEQEGEMYVRDEDIIHMYETFCKDEPQFCYDAYLKDVDAKGETAQRFELPDPNTLVPEVHGSDTVVGEKALKDFTYWGLLNTYSYLKRQKDRQSRKLLKLVEKWGKAMEAKSHAEIAKRSSLDDSFLVKAGTFERCQHGDQMRAAWGEAGYGVYAYPLSSASSLRPYYSSRGEEVFRLHLKPGATMVDLTREPLLTELVQVATHRFQERSLTDPNYRVPNVTKNNIQRFGSVIEDFIKMRYPEVSGYLVAHHGPGVPSGKQAVITKLENFVVEPTQPSKTAAITDPKWVLRNAEFYQDQFEAADNHPAWVPAKSLNWIYAPQFELTRLAGFSNGDFQWAVGEVGEEAEFHSGDGDYTTEFRKALKDGSIEPVVIAQGTDMKFYVWDGNHRVGEAEALGVTTLPAYVGMQKQGEAN